MLCKHVLNTSHFTVSSPLGGGGDILEGNVMEKPDKPHVEGTQLVEVARDRFGLKIIKTVTPALSPYQAGRRCAPQQLSTGWLSAVNASDAL